MVVQEAHQEVDQHHKMVMVRPLEAHHPHVVAVVQVGTVVVDNLEEAQVVDPQTEQDQDHEHQDRVTTDIQVMLEVVVVIDAAAAVEEQVALHQARTVDHQQIIHSADRHRHTQVVVVAVLTAVTHQAVVLMLDLEDQTVVEAEVLQETVDQVAVVVDIHQTALAATVVAVSLLLDTQSNTSNNLLKTVFML
jgi:ACT domain-containing protein